MLSLLTTSRMKHSQSFSWYHPWSSIRGSLGNHFHYAFGPQQFKAMSSGRLNLEPFNQVKVCPCIWARSFSAPGGAPIPDAIPTPCQLRYQKPCPQIVSAAVSATTSLMRQQWPAVEAPKEALTQHHVDWKTPSMHGVVQDVEPKRKPPPDPHWHPATRCEAC